MARVIAFANPASRTGKTTSAARLCLELAGHGEAVLAIDTDPRAELTRSFGIDTEQLSLSLHDAIARGAAVTDVRVATEFGVDLIAAAPELSLAEGLLVARAGREVVLRALVEAVRDEYDVIVIDTPSSHGLLMQNALAAADELVIPGAASHPRAVAELRRAAAQIKQFVNPDLQLP